MLIVRSNLSAILNQNNKKFQFQSVDMILLIFFFNNFLLILVRSQNFVSSPIELRGLWCIAEWDNEHQIYSRQLGQGFFYNNQTFTWNFLKNQSVTWFNELVRIDQTFSDDTFQIFSRTRKGPSQALNRTICLWLLRLNNGDYRWGESTDSDKSCGNSFDSESSRYSTVYTRRMPHCRLFDDEDVTQPITFVRYHEQLLKFDQMLSKEKRKSIVFYGASSIRLWRTFQDDFVSVPHGVINRGFGGATLEECWKQFKRIVVPLEPRALILYAGENDLAAGRKPIDVELIFFQFIQTIRRYFPRIPIAYVSIKPTLYTSYNINDRNETNMRIATMIRDLPGVDYIDIFNRMFTSDGQSRPELYADDNVHMSREGYEIWRKVLLDYFARKGLMTNELTLFSFISILSFIIVSIQLYLLYHLIPFRSIFRLCLSKLFFI